MLKLYRNAGIDIEEMENGLRERVSGLPLLEIEENPVGFESILTNIRGDPKKLKALGWRPTVPIDNILEQLC